MGAYLTTSILTKLSVNKSDLQKLSGSILDNKKLIEAKIFHSDEALFDCNESESSYDFNVKEGIIEKDLSAFMKKFYGEFYGVDNSKCNRIIEDLENVEKAKDLISIAEQTKYQNFRLNCYGSMGLTIEDQKMRARYNSIIIAMEGKIIMEEYGGHFTFFEKLLRRSYSEFTISKLVRVSIFG